MILIKPRVNISMTSLIQDTKKIRKNQIRGRKRRINIIIALYKYIVIIKRRYYKKRAIKMIETQLPLKTKYIY